jgi:hypothetical protein
MTQPSKEQIGYNKTFIRWLIGAIIVLLICVTIVICITNTYTIRLEMDNNTLEAVKSINWSALPK